MAGGGWRGGKWHFSRARACREGQVTHSQSVSNEEIEGGGGALVVESSLNTSFPPLPPPAAS